MGMQTYLSFGQVNRMIENCPGDDLVTSGSRQRAVIAKE